MADTVQVTIEGIDTPVPMEWVTISGSLDGAWELLDPISVYVYAEGDEFVATYDDPIPINAFGVTREDAIANLRTEIVEHLQWLEGADTALAPRLMRQRARLRTLVRRVGA
ncbi:MAG: hypothetical protein DCC58_20370 [Chloroflexi bacterium]|nr:MAG: hypothetical protein DCC58_20370 [Chloroflexota bacterium]